jgi:hypothetical protein
MRHVTITRPQRFLKTNDGSNLHHDSGFPIRCRHKAYLRIEDRSSRPLLATRFSCQKRAKEPQRLGSWINAAAAGWSASLWAGVVIMGA